MVLDFAIRIYEEESLEIISDIYGVSNEISTVTHRADLRQLLAKVTGLPFTIKSFCPDFSSSLSRLFIFLRASTGSEEMDVKAVLNFSTVVFKTVPVELISQVSVSPLDTGRMSSLPGMVVYMQGGRYAQGL